MTASEVTHAEVRERFGLPVEQIGSVNDPRTHEEHGLRWNEKWIYALPGGGRRIVYWHRYDFRGAVREEPDGSVRSESL
ncbi:MAG: hypothetical protein ACHQ6T_02105 [Myxococcota bacterium]